MSRANDREALSLADAVHDLLEECRMVLPGALIMTPAAYHRQTGPREASGRFLALGGQLLIGSLVPLMIGVGIDVYLIARIILGTRAAAAVLAVLLLACFAHCWFVWPRMAAAKGLR